MEFVTLQIDKIEAVAKSLFKRRETRSEGVLDQQPQHHPTCAPL